MALLPTTTIRRGNIELSTAELMAVIDELQTKVTALATLATECKTDHNGLLAKLDADAGVTDTNYAATQTVAAASVTV
jgi:hypothetical protein